MRERRERKKWWGRREKMMNVWMNVNLIFEFIHVLEMLWNDIIGFVINNRRLLKLIQCVCTFKLIFLYIFLPHRFARKATTVQWCTSSYSSVFQTIFFNNGRRKWNVVDLVWCHGLQCWWKDYNLPVFSGEKRFSVDKSSCFSHSNYVLLSYLERPLMFWKCLI